MQVERRSTRPDSPAHILDGGLQIPLFLEQLEGGVDQKLPRPRPLALTQRGRRSGHGYKRSRSRGGALQDVEVVALQASRTAVTSSSGTFCW